MNDEIKAILEQFEARQQQRLGALAEITAQTFEVMASDRHRLYQEIARELMKEKKRNDGEKTKQEESLKKIAELSMALKTEDLLEPLKPPSA